MNEVWNLRPDQAFNTKHGIRERTLPLFTFRIENGKTPLETVASDCATAEEAKSQALRLAAESIADFKPDFWLHPVWLLSVMDNKEIEVLTLEFRGHNKTSKKGG
jgi:hypothetical protein